VSQFTALLQFGSLLLYHNFLNLRLSCRRWSSSFSTSLILYCHRTWKCGVSCNALYPTTDKAAIHTDKHVQSHFLSGISLYHLTFSVAWEIVQ